MAKQNKEKLQERIKQLEMRVSVLEKELEGRSGADKAGEKDGNRVAAGRGNNSGHHRNWQLDNIQMGEEWLNRIGVGLLLIGVAFLFKYSIDQGWLIPPVRSAIGLGVGMVLFGSGLGMRGKAGTMRQVLLGGGIATFYLTAFATFQLYAFMPQTVVWAFMVAVTLLSLSLSLKQDEAVLSVVGTLGALGTPFMLYSGEGSVMALVLYLVLVLSGASAIYMQKGWRMLLWSIAAGSIVLAVGIVNTTLAVEDTAAAEQWTLQGGVMAWMITAWLLPVGRELIIGRNPRWWQRSQASEPETTAGQLGAPRPASDIHLLSFLVPLFVLVLSLGIWDVSMQQAGAGAFMLATLAALVYWPLKNARVNGLASTHAMAGLVMLTIGLFLVLEGNVLFVILMAETAALRYVAYHTKDEKASVSSHLLFGIVIFWMFNLFRYGEVSDSFLMNMEALSQLTVMGIGGLLIPRWLEQADKKNIYRIACHIAFMIWIYQKGVVLDNGQAWITLAWGAYAVLLLLLGFIRYGRMARLAGMATIFIVVGKLFLVDLAKLQAISRILLFMGFGTVFLIIGYYWQFKWNRDKEERGLSNN